MIRATEQTTLTGTLDAIRFHKTGFLIGKLESGISVKGPMVSPQVGMEYAFRGRMERHPRFGDTFVFTDYTASYPKDATAIRAYLMENCKWIGPEISKRLVNAYGQETLAICKTDPERVAREIPGLTSKRALEIAAMLRNNEANEELQLRLTELLHGTRVSRRATAKMVELWGHEAPDRVRANPYELIEAVDGIGFVTADDVARKVGYQRDGLPRMQAGLVHRLRELAFAQGHTAVPAVLLLEEAGKLLDLPRAVVEPALNVLADNQLIVIQDELISLVSLFEDEQFIAKKLRFLVGQTLPPGQPDFEGLADDQREALTKAMNSGVFILTGAPGTGKTYTIKRIINSFPEARVALAAPSGKAAKRIFEQSGLKAHTIHKLLEPQMRDGRFVFTRNAENPLEANLIVLDECFDYKQPILTEDGWKYIGRVVESREPVKVWSRNPQTGRLELQPILRWLKYPAPDRLLRICASRSDSMRNMRLLRCTPDHQILTPYGYRRARELRPGEEVIVRGYSFTPEQRSMVIGALLGDGCMSRPRRRRCPQIVLSHGEAQRKYLEFKRRAFGVLAGKITQGRSGYLGKPVWQLWLNTIDETYEIAQEMLTKGAHPSGQRRWIPSNRFLSWIDEQALAVWYLDNGSLSKRRLTGGRSSVYATIHSERFDEEDNRRFAAVLKQRFWLEATVGPAGHGYFRLRFSKAATTRLLEIVRPFVPPCMAYKLAAESNYRYEPEATAETSVGRIQSIQTVASTRPHVYDVEVAEHHNYVAGNIVVSNCSMVDVPLMARLLEALGPSTRLILVGDTYQLPSVGAGNILKDAIASGIIPTTELTIIKRQDEGLIIRNCHKIKNGEDIALGNSSAKDFFFLKRDSEEAIRETLLELVGRRLAESYGVHPLKEVQVISPLREKTSLSCKALNAAFQQRLNPNPPVEGSRFRVGDKVIQNKNEYDKDIINGDIGYVLDIDASARALKVAFENPERIVDLPLIDNELELAYAVTVHKYQGSEAPIIIIPIHQAFGPFLMQRNLLYTAVSRAQKVCILVGQRDEIRKIIGRNQQQKRFTRLRRFLVGHA